MGQYVKVFVVPRGTRDRVIKSFVSYRQGALRPYYEGELTMPAKSGGLFVPDYDDDRDVWVTTAERWLEIIAAFRQDVATDSEVSDATGLSSPGPIYEDDCTWWLKQQKRIDDIEIVITEET